MNSYQLVHFPCSIRKYFGLPYHHETIPVVDQLFEQEKPENVVVILFDGMGSRILDRTLEDQAFFKTHMLGEIRSVFPATTTAATTSMKTGLTPVEHGMLGWNMYIEPLDQIIELYTGIEKETGKVNETYLEKHRSYFPAKEITKELQEQGKIGLEISPYGDKNYQDLYDMMDVIQKTCREKGKKYLYVYDPEPDHTMHELGSDHEKVRKLIQERNDQVQKLSQQLENTLLFVVADHGHTTIQYMDLEDAPEVMELLEKTTSLEQRTISFRVKKGKEQLFETRFLKRFGKAFQLYSKQQVIDLHLFGTGKEHPFFESAIGDYIAVAISNQALCTKEDFKLISHHAGITEDEVLIPLIAVCCNIVKKKYNYGMNGLCVFNDDMPKILDTILESDMIVFATPIYYFGFSAQIKSAIDRFYSRNGKIQNKHFKSVFIATAWNHDEQVMSGIEKHIDILIDYLNLDNQGMLLAKGYGYTGASTEKQYMEEAYHLGQSI